MFLGEGVAKICSKLTEHPCQSVISIKLLCNFIEITIRHGCSPVNLLLIFRTPFTKNTSGWLLLKSSIIDVWPSHSKNVPRFSEQAPCMFLKISIKIPLVANLFLSKDSTSFKTTVSQNIYFRLCMVFLENSNLYKNNHDEASHMEFISEESLLFYLDEVTWNINFFFDIFNNIWE